MPTTESPSSLPSRSLRLPGRRYDHVFFCAMAALLLASVFIGFAHTYYLAGVYRAPLPSLIIHLHGAAFSIWILLFVTQTALISARRLEWHRRLGTVTFAWACLMVILGLLAAADALARGAGPPGVIPRHSSQCPLATW